MSITMDETKLKALAEELPKDIKSAEDLSQHPKAKRPEQQLGAFQENSYE